MQDSSIPRKHSELIYYRYTVMKSSKDELR